MKNRAWYAYLLGAAAATGIYFVSGHQSWIYNLIGLSSPVLILVAVRAHKPDPRAPWFLFALGQFLFILGDVLAYNYERFFHTELPYPSIADLFYLLVYPCLALGLLLLLRRRSPGRDWASVIDSLMIAIGVSTLSWVFLIGPNWHAEGDLLQRLTSMAYPIMDVILVTVAIRLAVGAGKRVPAFRLILGAIVVLFVTDSAYGWTLLHTPYVPGSGYLEIGWIAFYVMWGMGALHPSMGSLSERAPETGVHLTWPRLALLGGAALMPPVLLVGEMLGGQQVDIVFVLGATIVLFLLVVLRMAGLVRTQEHSAVRERALREAGQALVTATNAEGIHAAAIEATIALAGENAAVRICELNGSGVFEVVAAAGGTTEPIGLQFPLSDIRASRRERLLANRAYTVETGDSGAGEMMALPDTAGSTTMIAPLFIVDELRGMVVVGTPDEMPLTVVDSLSALSSQVALALESAALTEDLLKQQSEKRFASLVQNSSDIVAVLDADTSVRYASPSAQRVLGYAPESLEGTRFIDLVHPDDKTKALSFLTSLGDSEGQTGLLEFQLRCEDGSYVVAETLRTSLLHDDNVHGIVLNTRDITERKRLQEELERQAFNDSVTNLANRALFSDRVGHAIERQERDHKPIAVLVMDLDDFKTINDSLGHVAGDSVLREVGERLGECLRTADTAARLGGDEFAILLEDGGDGIQAVEVADRVMQALEAPFNLEDKEVFVRASVGIAVAGGEVVTNAEELLRNADVAMYMAKERGKGRYQVFEPAMHDTALKRLEMKADLQRALEHEEFQLYYQPVIELESGHISGVEALIRWIHPVRGMVMPLDFIPLAEETGLIVPIGRWVLREACRAAVSLHEQYPDNPTFHMAVNISARQIARPEIVEEVRSILAETGLDPHSLTLEITESAMMQDMELSIERLTALKSLGVQLAIDDFGTGYSSLNYVRRFPVDILKVDKSFIDGVGEGGESSALTAAVIELAGILNLKPVAEGIERTDQLERLLQLKCDFGQGYLFAKPLPSERPGGHAHRAAGDGCRSGRAGEGVAGGTIGADARPTRPSLSDRRHLVPRAAGRRHGSDHLARPGHHATPMDAAHRCRGGQPPGGRDDRVPGAGPVPAPRLGGPAAGIQREAHALDGVAQHLPQHPDHPHARAGHAPSVGRRAPRRPLDRGPGRPRGGSGGHGGVGGRAEGEGDPEDRRQGDGVDGTIPARLVRAGLAELLPPGLRRPAHGPHVPWQHGSVRATHRRPRAPRGHVAHGPAEDRGHPRPRGPRHGGTAVRPGRAGDHPKPAVRIADPRHGPLVPQLLRGGPGQVPGSAGDAPDGQHRPGGAGHRGLRAHPRRARRRGPRRLGPLLREPRHAQGHRQPAAGRRRRALGRDAARPPGSRQPGHAEGAPAPTCRCGRRREPSPTSPRCRDGFG